MIGAERTLDVNPEFVDQTLDCYLPNVRYLRSARVTHAQGFEAFESELGSCVAVAHGTFASQPPWYIRDTGHFNAIEFNICYNQLAFVLVRQCVELGLNATLSDYIPKQDFIARMLPALVILRYSVTFDRPMLAPEFSGSLGIVKVVHKMRRLFLQTRFWVGPSDGSWCSRGDVTLAVLRSGPVVSEFTSVSREENRREASLQ